ncbi:hypothetical protein SAMN05421505_14913 [Sinosporangium album]|uniref:Uncharacterized protein n=1 Tax=Sinosporangium album TaxID=504805 RepID=A0A1G8KB46_9ACTN|nr:hypothetical protein [Sinosporangium album]SDI40613.1 hypothetical protein SAMN05421505_14913 [Sinosporangium album]
MSNGLRECARAERCSAPRIDTDPTGRTNRRPALTPRPLCDADRTAVANTLTAIPALYVHVHQHMEQTLPALASGPRISISKTPPALISLGADELLRLMLDTLVSWEERVRTVARLTPLDTGAARLRRDGVALVQATETLASHLDALLALPNEPMTRNGDLVDLSGADAGLEILDLARRCRVLLGDTLPSARHLHGVMCGFCGWPELYEVLIDGVHAGATCQGCGNDYDAAGYRDLLSQQARRARTHARRMVSVAEGDDDSTRRA